MEARERAVDSSVGKKPSRELPTIASLQMVYLAMVPAVTALTQITHHYIVIK